MLPSKYQYLLSAPLKDFHGNDAIIRFSRKTNQQYVMSEKNGKPTSWKAIYKDKKWTI